MGIRRPARRVAKAGVLLGLLTVGAVYAWTFLWPFPQPEDLRPAQTILCLGGGLTDDGSLGPYSVQRTRACAQLYHADLAPVVAFTGGNTTHDTPSTGQQMADLARRLGVPAAAIVVEDRSASTLQNALFTLPELGSRHDIILVTDSFHLPRAAMSFHWAGARNMQLAASAGKTGGLMPGHLLIWAEAGKVWINLARMPVYEAAGLFGVKPEHRAWMLH